MHRQVRPLRFRFLHVVLLGLPALAACNREPPVTQPQWQLQPSSQQAIATDDAAASPAVAMTPQQQEAALQAQILAESQRNAARSPNPARRIDPEAARAAAGAVQGVRSVVWVDGENLLALVDSNARRSYQTIDEICYQLQPLGDTLGVVVNLQSAAARDGDELEILSRNCQLAPGDRAAMQANRQVDALSPELRAQYQSSKQRLEAAAEEQRHSRGDKQALQAIPEM